MNRPKNTLRHPTPPALFGELGKSRFRPVRISEFNWGFIQLVVPSPFNRTENFQ